MQIDEKGIKKILVVRNDRFGEFLLNIPALRALKETFSQARIIAVVNPYVKELAECVPFIDEIIIWPSKRQSFMQKLKIASCLRKKGIDLAVMLNPSQEFNFITWLAGIPVRVGYNRKWPFLLNRKLEDKKHLGDKHEVEYNLELVGLVGAKTQDKSLSLKIKDDFQAEGYDLIAINPKTSDAVKDWGRENFKSLANRLAEIPNCKVLIIGGKEEAEDNSRYFDNIQDNIINLTGKTSLKGLASILKQCRLLISGDSGPVHLASSVGTRVLAIFRNDLPGKTAKRWGPWGEAHAVIEKSDLSKINVEEVFNKAKEMIR